MTAAPVVTGDGAGGIASLVIDGIEAGETGSLEISSPAGEVVRVAVNGNQTRVEIPSYRVGSNTASLVTVTPYSRFELPPGLGGSASGAAATVQANGVGSPLSPQLTLSSVSNGDETATITANASAVLNGDGSSLRYGIVRDGERCTVAATGSTATFSVADGDEYTYRVCVESYWGDRSYGRAETIGHRARAAVRPGPRRAGPSPSTPTPNVSGQRADWIIRADPTTTERIPNRNHPEFSGWNGSTSVVGQSPGIQVRYVHDWWGTATALGHRDAARRQCAVPGAGDVGGHLVRAAGAPSPIAADRPTRRTARPPRSRSATPGCATTTTRTRLLTSEPGTWTVPIGAVRVEGIDVSVNWDGQGWGLAPVSTTFRADCQPNNGNPPPGPTP